MFEINKIIICESQSRATQNDYIWINLTFKESHKYYSAINRDTNEKICEFSIYEYEDTYIRVDTVLYNIFGFNSAIKAFCKFIFSRDKNLEKVTVGLLSHEIIGRIFYKVSGFKREIKIKNFCKINNKNNHYLIYSFYKEQA